MTKSEIAKHAIKIVEFVDECEQDMACFELVFNGGNKDGRIAKVIILIENENTEMEQTES
jgi:hypothetical protein